MYLALQMIFILWGMTATEQIMTEHYAENCKYGGKKNQKLNNGKCHFRHTSIPFFGNIISREGKKPNPRKLKVLTGMSSPKLKKEL